MDEENRKNVDESYKAQVEKDKASPSPEQGFVPPEANFTFFITTLGMQAAIALGDLENPQSGKKEENFDQAKFLIDTLDVLKEKTKNNLNKEEVELLEGILYELRMRYVQKAGKSG